MKYMTRTALILACLALPQHVEAQISFDQALRAYYAAHQINNEVWQNNPNEAEMARHALLVMEWNGVGVPGINAGAVDPSIEPQWGLVDGPQCVWVQDENGEWVPRCDEWGTYGPCYSPKMIGDMWSLYHGSWWASWFYNSAAIYAGSVGQVPAAAFLAGMGQFFAGTGWLIERRAQNMEGRRCQG